MNALVKLGTVGAIFLAVGCSSTTSTTTTSSADAGEKAEENGGNGGTGGTGTVAPPPKKDADAATSNPQADAGSTTPAETCVPVNIDFGSPACNTCSHTNCCDEENECAGEAVLVDGKSACLDFGNCANAAFVKFSEEHDGGQPEQADVQKIVQDCEALHTGGGQPYIKLVQCISGPACKTDCS